MFTSGLAAVSVVSDLLSPGDHIICCDDVYGGSQRFFRNVKKNHGIHTDMVDMSNIDNITKAITDKTKVSHFVYNSTHALTLCPN